MEEIIPWEEWVEYVRPYYPDGKRGRPTKGIETMLRMYLLQVWFNLSDEGVEDAIYDSYASLVRLIRVFFSCAHTSLSVGIIGIYTVRYSASLN